MCSWAPSKGQYCVGMVRSGVLATARVRTLFSACMAPCRRTYGRSGATDSFCTSTEIVGALFQFRGAEDGGNLTGVWALSAEEVYICSSSGALFHGSHNGLERLGEYPYRFYGIVEFDGELYLAAGDHGVCVLRGNVIEQVKKTFSTSGIYRLPTRIAFVEPNQSEKPRVVVHDPADPKPWSGWSA